MSLRPRVAGVDFSGARDAGRHIWIAEGEPTGKGLAVTGLIRADRLPGGAAEAAPALSALVEHLGGLHDSVVGLDFPFGLPRPLVRERTWLRFAENFVAAYPEADGFRAACRAATGGRELRRRTDTEARVPWCAYNIRLYRQTWAGIRHVLWPLVRTDRARVLPVQAPAPGKPLLAEICPASFLKREDLYAPYKGRAADRRDARARILRRLVDRGRLSPVPSSHRRTILDDAGGDALDAVLAAIGATRIDDPAPRDRIDRIEARIYY